MLRIPLKFIATFAVTSCTSLLAQTASPTPARRATPRQPSDRPPGIPRGL